MESQESICMQEYDYKNQLIHKGSESMVYRAINRSRSQQPHLAFKGYEEGCLNDKVKQKRLMGQLSCLWKLQARPNIIQIISQHTRDGKVFIITEYCEEGTLADELKKVGPFKQDKAIAYIRQIISGYQHLYEAEIIHRSIQPQNILCKGFQLKIGDFSDSLQRGEVGKLLGGSTLWRAPQAIQEGKFSSKSDVYSIGAVFYSMLTGSSPKIQFGKKMQEMSKSFPKFSNPRITDFLKRTLQPNMQKRMDVDQMLIFSFGMIPKLNRLKMFTFDKDISDLMAEQQLRDQLHKKTSFQPQQRIETNKKVEIVHNPSYTNNSLNKFSAFDLKLSDDHSVSRIYKDKQVSIFFPSKLDITSNQVGKFLQQNHQLQGLELSSSNSSAKAKIQRISNRKQAVGQKLVDSNFKFPAFGIKHNDQIQKKGISTVKQFKITDNQDLDESINIGQFKKKDQPAIIQINKYIEIPLLQINNSQKKPNKVNSVLLTSKRSSQQGIFTKRGKEDLKIIVKQQGNENNCIIAAWLVTQIDMFRFLNRVLHRIRRANLTEINSLSPKLVGLKIYIISNLRKLSCLSQEQRETFLNSPQHLKLVEIIQNYAQGLPSEGRFDNFPQLIKEILQKISLVFQKISGSRQMQEQLIRLLDFLITLWQLCTVLKRKNWQQFHRKSNLSSILDAQEFKPTIGHILMLYDRMKALGLS